MKDYTGIKIGKLTAVSFCRRIKKTTYWNFNCECGINCSLAIDYVFNGRKRHCGCEKLPRKITSFRSPSMSVSKNREHSALSAYFRMYKKSAKERKYPFLISKEEFQELTNKNCFYCGITPSKNYMNFGVLFNGIDRKNNDIGYELYNMVTCCEICNKAKRNLSYLDFTDWIKRLCIHNKT